MVVRNHDPGALRKFEKRLWEHVGFERTTPSKNVGYCARPLVAAPAIDPLVGCWSDCYELIARLTNGTRQSK
jgi:hypothetical protein